MGAQKRMDDKQMKVAKGIGAATLGVIGAAAVAATTGGPQKAKQAEHQVTRTTMKAEEAVIDASWDLPQVRNERVDFFIEYLMTKKHDEMHEWLERLGKYGPFLRAELQARGMPQDLVYLAMIESGFDPRAYSRADASGLWQFIAETGRRYGLEIDEWVDERNDPVKATGAALDYLQELHDRFDSWFLAAAAYNTGENRVGRIMREEFGTEKGDDDRYWDISARLPKETRDYVPLMLAAAHIAKDPAKYGFTGLEFQEPLEYDEVRVPAKTPLSRVADAAGVALERIEALNPHLKKDVTPPRPAAVKVPVGAGEQLAASLGVEPAGTSRTLTD